MSDDKVLVPRELLEVYLGNRDGDWVEAGQILRDLLAQPADGALTNNLNQCDGCRAGKPLENGNRHRMGKEGGYPDFMSCTAKIYKPALTNEGAEPVAWVNGEQLRLCIQSPLDESNLNPAARHLPRNIGGSALKGSYCDTPLYRHPPKVCTCPSGDGSLRWPCPVHPPEPTAVAWECDDSAGETGRVLVTNDPAVRDEWVRQELPVCPLFGPSSTESRS